MNYSFARLTLLNTVLSQSNDLFCENCNLNLKVEDCMNTNYNVCCPFDNSHKLTHAKLFDTEKRQIKMLINQINALRGKKPVRNFKANYKRNNCDCSQTARVVSKKS